MRTWVVPANDSPPYLYRDDRSVMAFRVAARWESLDHGAAAKVPARTVEAASGPVKGWLRVVGFATSPERWSSRGPGPPCAEVWTNAPASLGHTRRHAVTVSNSAAMMAATAGIRRGDIDAVETNGTAITLVPRPSPVVGLLRRSVVDGLPDTPPAYVLVIGEHRTCTPWVRRSPRLADRRAFVELNDD